MWELEYIKYIESLMYLSIKVNIKDIIIYQKDINLDRV